MSELWQQAQATALAEWLAVLFAVAYLLLAIRENILCWFAALVSTGIYFFVFLDAKLYMEAGLQVFYAGMALYGWYRWRLGAKSEQEGAVVVLAWPEHAKILAAIGVGTIGLGYGVSLTDAALPWLDTFTTVAAMVTTYLVAIKVLENWGYWFVIDSLSIYLYLSRGLVLTALLFGIYLVLIFFGYARWSSRWRAGGRQRSTLTF